MNYLARESVRRCQFKLQNDYYYVRSLLDKVNKFGEFSVYPIPDSEIEKRFLYLAIPRFWNNFVEMCLLLGPSSVKDRIWIRILCHRFLRRFVIKLP